MRAAGMCVAGVLVLLAVLSHVGSGTSTESLGRAIGRAQAMRSFVSYFSSFWGVLVAFLCVTALVLLARKTGRIRADTALTEVFQQEFERIAAEMQAGTAERLPPSPEMNDIDEQIWRGRRILAEMEASSTHDGRQELLRTLEYLYAHRFAADVRRRMTLQIDPNRILTPPPASFAGRVQTFLVSRGLLASMHGGSRAVTLASLFLLIPSLVSIQSGAAASLLDTRLVRLNELRVEASVRESEEAWKRAQAAVPPPAPAPEQDDEAALDVLSREFENALASSRAWKSIPRGSVSLRTTSVRQRILRVRAEHAAEALDLVPGATMSQEVTRLQSDTLEEFERTHNTRGPRTGVGRRFRAELTRLRAERPEVWSRLRAAGRAAGTSFQQAATTDDFGRFLASRIVGSVLEGVPSEGALGQLARELTDQMGTGAIERFYRGQSLQYMTALARGQSIPEATRVVAEEGRTFWTAFQSSSFESYVREKARCAERVADASSVARTACRAQPHRDPAGAASDSAAEYTRAADHHRRGRSLR